MTHDQADELRALARRAQCQRDFNCQPPRRVLVAAGTAGAGATSIALALATQMAKQGSRTVLIDAAGSRPDATTRCRVDDHDNIADVLAGRRSIHEVLRQGPAGLQVVPGAWASSEPAAASPSSSRRLLHEIDGLGPYCDLAVIDGGAGSSRLLRTLWQSVDAVLLIVSEEPTATMDAYAAVKIATAGTASPQILTVFNRCHDAAIAADSHRRIAQAAQRFLSLQIGCAATVPYDDFFTLPLGDSESQPRWETTVALNYIAAAALGESQESSRQQEQFQTAA